MHIYADDQIKINELQDARTAGYNELIQMVEDDNYDIAAIDSINSDIDEIDMEIRRIIAKYMPIMKKLNK